MKKIKQGNNENVDYFKMQSKLLKKLKKKHEAAGILPPLQPPKKIKKGKKPPSVPTSDEKLLRLEEHLFQTPSVLKEEPRNFRFGSE